MTTESVSRDSLAGRAALVTGAGRGIGRAIALELAGAGAAVALVARSAGELARTADLISAAGGEAVVLPADLADAEQVGETAQRAADELGAVDILVNNAAVVWPLGPSVSVDLTDWAAALEINVVAVARLTFALLPGMLAEGWGRVANVSSGIAGNPASMIGANAYATSKAAIEGHTLSLAAELAGTGVTVNAYRPGRVDTAMQGWIREQDPERIGAGLHEKFRSWHEEGALITPEASASVLAALLPGDATGQIWSVTQLP
jgi:NAD(P)-dependent dehydrogenase (short-subunit alcohol dehydrogenase family)